MPNQPDPDEITPPVQPGPTSHPALSTWSYLTINLVAAGMILVLVLSAMFLPGGAQLTGNMEASEATGETVQQTAGGHLASAAPGSMAEFAPAPKGLAVPDTAGSVTQPDGMGLSQVKTAFGALSGDATPQPALPPIPSLGGTCIQGVIMDRYEQLQGPGWTVTITSEQGQAVPNLTSDPAGNFQSPRLQAGVYVVELGEREGWRPFTPASFKVTLDGASAECANVRFKVETLACLEAIKLDAGGQMGLPEKVGLPGWKITVSQGTTTLNGVTDGKGRVIFYNLEPGTWVVEEQMQSGWRPVAGGSRKAQIDLTSPRQPGQCQQVVFENEQVHDSCIIVRKVDMVGNPLPNWEYTVSRDDGTWPATSGQTNQIGEATFLNLALGDWTVTETSKAWWRPVGSVDQKVELKDPGMCTVLTFVNEPLGCIDGYKINHLEQGLSGLQVTASNISSGEAFSTTTGQDGYFKFMLPLGTWRLSETLPPGWTPVTPAEFTVTTTKPFECEHVRFKNKTEFACVDVFAKDRTADGEEYGLAGWTMQVQPAYGGEPQMGKTDGTGWMRFNGLTPGYYTISEQMQPGWEPSGPDSQTIKLEPSGGCTPVTFYNHQLVAPAPQTQPAPTNTPVVTTIHTCRAHYCVWYTDRLADIAAYFGVSVDAIRQANGLTSNQIYPGQVLCIP